MNTHNSLAGFVSSGASPLLTRPWQLESKSDLCVLRGSKLPTTAVIMAVAPPTSPGADPTAFRLSRRAVLTLSTTALASLVLSSPTTVEAGAVRRASRMSGDYKADAAMLLQDMKDATDLVRGSPNMTEVVSRTREDMMDFVALYRRNDKVAGSASYSVLYTASNTLSGHYASYGPNYPVPEKRKKRLQQQFGEIERALARGR